MSAAPVLHHVTFKTNRLQEMIDWYSLVVGAKVNHQFPGGAWLTNDAANHRVAMLAVPGLSDDPDKVSHTGMHHSAYEYPSMERPARQLRAPDATPASCPTAAWTTA